jgi:hypothetical protein
MAERSSYHRIPFGAIFTPDIRGSGLEIRYLMQAFSFDPQKHAASMLVDVVVANPTDEGARFRLVHYGLPEKTRMTMFSRAGGVAEKKLGRALRDVYGKLIVESGDDKMTMHQKVNGIGYGEAFDASLAGPGRCLSNGEEICLENISSGFLSSYLIPPRKFGAMQPGEISACRIGFELGADDYDRMVSVEGRIDIDSPSRISRDITTYDADAPDLPEKDRILLEGYASHLIPVRDEDVVILPRKNFEVDGSISICPNFSIEEARANKAYYFSSHDFQEWCLRLRPKKVAVAAR